MIHRENNYTAGDVCIKISFFYRFNVRETHWSHAYFLQDLASITCHVSSCPIWIVLDHWNIRKNSLSGTPLKHRKSIEELYGKALDTHY